MHYAKNFIGLCRLSRFISSHFGTSLLKCPPLPKIAKKTLKSPGSKSLKVINVDTILSSSIVLVMISSMSVPICNCFHASRANSGKTTNFYRSIPLT